MKTYLFIDAKNESVMMVNANNPVDAAKSCRETTDIAFDHYILVGSMDHKVGKCCERTI